MAAQFLGAGADGGYQFRPWNIGVLPHEGADGIGPALFWISPKKTILSPPILEVREVAGLGVEVGKEGLSCPSAGDVSGKPLPLVFSSILPMFLPD